MNSVKRIAVDWRLRSRTLRLGVRTLVMGVVNITPDSFSDGGQFLNADRAVEHALGMLDEGADIVDLGAESTRPGSSAGVIKAGTEQSPALSAEAEQARLLPVLEGILRARPEAILSVDTYKAATARAAIAAGAQIVNDVSGLTWDAAMADACAELLCGVVLMHTRGTPEEWREQPPLGRDGVLPAVREGLLHNLNRAMAVGITKSRIVLDPGYGFGKRFDDNYFLLARQSQLLGLGSPLLAGLSRKSFLTRGFSGMPQRWATPDGEGRASEGRETASVAALVSSILQGASVVRVHRVAAAIEAAAVADGILAAS